MFGSIWMGIIAYGCLLTLIAVLGRMGSFLLMALLALYFVTMFVLFGGLVGWLLLMIGASIYFASQIIKYTE